MKRQMKSAVDPKLFRKHSQIIHKQQQEAEVIIGERKLRDWGWDVDSYASKYFEVQQVVVMPNAMTPVWTHPKKNRFIRVISGLCAVETFLDIDSTKMFPRGDAQPNPVNIQVLTAGGQFEAAAGVFYRIAAKEKTVLLLVHDAKYEHGLQVVAPSPLVDVPVTELHSITAADQDHRLKVFMGLTKPTRRNKAREQLAEARGVPAPPSRAEGSEEELFRNSAAGINAMPVLDFDPEGAG